MANEVFNDCKETSAKIIPMIVHSLMKRFNSKKRPGMAAFPSAARARADLLFIISVSEEPSSFFLRLKNAPSAPKRPSSAAPSVAAKPAVLSQCYRRSLQQSPQKPAVLAVHQ